MAKADYQLRHQLFGQQGSMWERQVTPEARTQIRRIVKEAGQSPILASIDQIAAAALNQKKVLVEDEFFRFTDGNFAVVGDHQRDYEHVETTLADGTRLQLAYRDPPLVNSDDPLPTVLAKITADFLKAAERDQGSLPTDRDWYLVPIPSALTPLVIEGRGADVYLVNGVDFLARDGYIILANDPALVLPSGVVRVSSAYKKVPTPNSFALSAPTVRGGTRYLAEYAYKSQAVSVFKKAAAEYAGLYVFQEADVVLRATQLGSTHWVYSMANAGVVEIRYPHVVLLNRQKVEPGYIISDGFDVFISEYAGDDLLESSFAAAAWGESISLDGILPVKGLSWDGLSPIVTDAVESTGGKDHIRLHFAGSPTNLQKFWDWQKRHELQTDTYLYDALGGATPASVDFWAILEDFYGIQLLLILAAGHTPTINSRLQRFIFEHHPKSCNVLLSAKLNTALNVAYTPEGIPIVGEDGEYVTEEEVVTVDALFDEEGSPILDEDDAYVLA